VSLYYQSAISDVVFWRRIIAGEFLVIPDYRILLFNKNIIVDGDLILNGDLVEV
jgi:hypothetical protein